MSLAGAARLLARGSEQTPSVLITDDPTVRAIYAPQSPRIFFSDLLLTGWIAGTAISLVPLVMGLWQIRSLRRRLHLIGDAEFPSPDAALPGRAG